MARSLTYQAQLASRLGVSDQVQALLRLGCLYCVPWAATRGRTTSEPLWTTLFLLYSHPAALPPHKFSTRSVESTRLPASPPELVSFDNYGQYEQLMSRWRGEW